MKRLPDNAKELPGGFQGLPDERKEKILGRLAALPSVKQSQAIKQILANEGEPARFVDHLLSKRVTERGAPLSKAKGAAQTK
jgi:hypothetical protein